MKNELNKKWEWAKSGQVLVDAAFGWPLLALKTGKNMVEGKKLAAAVGAAALAIGAAL